jgi:iron complex transport system ATP-binding protein
MSAAIELTDVVAGYHRRPVLDGISLSVHPGEMVGLLGPNGAGKTTLMRTITGLCPLLAGEVRLFGDRLAGISARERARRVAVVPQELDLPVAFTVEEVVMIGRTASLSRWATPSREDNTLVERAMIYTDVIDMRSRPFQELSGGEKQRVLVALAIAQEARAILMDEATSHLDLNHRLEVMQIVERLSREKQVAVVLSSHDMNLASEFCRRLVLMDKGVKVADGSPASVLNEESLRRVFRCDVRVQQNLATGAITVTPTARLAAGRSGRGIAVHVIAGGGCAEELFRCLSLCEYRVSAGVLNQGDSDTDLALAMELPVAIEKPFSPVSRDALRTATQMASQAQAVVIAATPFGPGNLANLDLADAAILGGKPVFVLGAFESRDYTPDHEATRRVRRLMAAGAVPVPAVSDLLRLLPSAPD